MRTLQAALAAIGVFAAVGCSDKRPFRAREGELTALLDALRSSKVAAEKFDKKQTAQPTTAPVVDAQAPFMPDPGNALVVSTSNTLVISDSEIDAMERRVDCSRVGVTSPPATYAVCKPPTLAGNTCALEAASVLRFGEFRDPSVPHKGYGTCAEWLVKVEYFLIVHMTEASSGVESSRSRGTATLVDRKSTKALARVEWNETAEATLGDLVEKSDLGGERKMYRKVLRDADAAPVLTLRAIARELPKAVPSADTSRLSH